MAPPAWRRARPATCGRAGGGRHPVRTTGPGAGRPRAPINRRAVPGEPRAWRATQRTQPHQESAPLAALNTATACGRGDRAPVTGWAGTDRDRRARSSHDAEGHGGPAAADRAPRKHLTTCRRAWRGPVAALLRSKAGAVGCGSAVCRSATAAGIPFSFARRSYRRQTMARGLALFFCGQGGPGPCRRAPRGPVAAIHRQAAAPTAPVHHRGRWAASAAGRR